MVSASWLPPWSARSNAEDACASLTTQIQLWARVQTLETILFTKLRIKFILFLIFKRSFLGTTCIVICSSCSLDHTIVCPCHRRQVLYIMYPHFQTSHKNTYSHVIIYVKYKRVLSKIGFNNLSWCL